MSISYINSSGKTFEFTKENGIRVMDADFHKYSYEYEGSELEFGIEKEKFKKKPCTYPAKLYFYGSSNKRSQRMNELHDAAEFDRSNRKRGKLFRGDWYIGCYIIEGDSYSHEDLNGVTVKDISFFCPYPFWIREVSKQFIPGSSSESLDGSNFPTDFPFDFAAEETGNEKWYIDHYTSSHFKMTIFGPCEDPRIFVNGYPYQIITTLAKEEYLVIESRGNTVTKYYTDGSTKNLYNSRSFANSVFEKIPCGQLQFNWSGTFGFDLTLYLERSEPKW